MKQLLTLFVIILLIHPAFGKSDDKKFNLVLSKATVTKAFHALSTKGKLNFILSPNATSAPRVTLSLNQVTVEEALEIILNASGLKMAKVGKVVKVFTEEEDFAKQKQTTFKKIEKDLGAEMELKIYPVSFTQAEQLLPIIKKSLVAKKALVSSHPQTGRLIVNDIPLGHKRVKKILKQLDVKLPELELTLRVLEEKSNRSYSIGTSGSELIAREISGKVNSQKTQKIRLRNLSQGKIQFNVIYNQILRTVDDRGFPKFIVKTQKIPTTLSVTPKIMPDNKIKLKLSYTLSSVTQTTADQPVKIDNQTITQEVTLASGATAVVAEINDSLDSNQNSKHYADRYLSTKSNVIKKVVVVATPKLIP